MDSFQYAVPAILGLPLLGFIITGLGGRMLTRSGARLVAAYIAALCVAASLALSIFVAYTISSEEQPWSYNLYTWIPSGDFNPTIGLWVDRLTAVMLLVVTGVATLVHIYAIGYMKDDGRDPSVEAHGGHDEDHGARDSHAVHDVHSAADAHGADDHVAHGTGESGTQPAGPAVIPANLPGDGGWRVAGGLQKDGGLARFFSFLNLFVFSMLVLVLANNYLMLFVGWELVGLSSFLLIGFWYQKRDIFEDIKGFFRRDVPFEASKKAFIVNRIGDFGFATGIMLMFVNFGSLAYGTVFQNVGIQSQQFILGNITLMCLLLFMGAMGKSAQFPLHVWLPDAMAGPTPVSALIHAATMVTAGVYMVARSNPLFHAAPDAMLVVLIIGTITALLGATIACTATDIKQVVAYSTVSQLGYMFAGLGGGMWIAAIFHLFTHAFFKGLLFLGSGSVLHGIHDLEGQGKDGQDIRWMGGLARYMPITMVTFLIGALANAGIVPFAGFWSKDEIISGLITKNEYGLGAIAGGLLWFGSFLTAFYMFRLFYMVFFNKKKWDPAVVHPHESPPVMTIPLMILAGAATLVGFLGFPPEAGAFHHYLDPVFKGVMGDEVIPAQGGYAAENIARTLGLQIASVLFAVVGIGLATLMYLRPSGAPEAMGKMMGPLYRAVRMRGYFDELYDLLFVRGGKGLANLLWAFDRNVIDGVVNGVAAFYGGASLRLRRIQTGFVANYAYAIALGVFVLLGYVLVSTLVR